MDGNRFLTAIEVHKDVEFRVKDAVLAGFHGEYALDALTCPNRQWCLQIEDRLVPMGPWSRGRCAEADPLRTLAESDIKVGHQAVNPAISADL